MRRICPAGTHIACDDKALERAYRSLDTETRNAIVSAISWAEGTLVRERSQPRTRVRDRGSSRVVGGRWARNAGFLYVLPALAFLLLFDIWPIFFGFWMSLWQWGVKAEQFIGFGNYGRIFREELLQRSFDGTMQPGGVGNALLVTVYFVVGTVPREPHWLQPWECQRESIPFTFPSAAPSPGTCLPRQECAAVIASADDNRADRRLLPRTQPRMLRARGLSTSCLSLHNRPPLPGSRQTMRGCVSNSVARGGAGIHLAPSIDRL